MIRCKVVASVLASVMLLTLASCGNKAEEQVQQALDFRAAVLGASTCGFTADVTADYGESVYDFTLEADYDPAERSTALTVTAPDSIAGICATIDGTDAELQFEEVSLVLETTGSSHIAPLRLPQILGDAWCYGYVESLSKEDEAILVTYRSGYDAEELLVYTWFDLRMNPERAEIYDQETCVLAAEIEDFSLE